MPALVVLCESWCADLEFRGSAGVLVNKVMPLGSAGGKLLPNDVLMAFDGEPIGCDGTVQSHPHSPILGCHAGLAHAIPPGWIGLGLIGLGLIGLGLGLSGCSVSPPTHGESRVCFCGRLCSAGWSGLATTTW